MHVSSKTLTIAYNSIHPNSQEKLLGAMHEIQISPTQYGKKNVFKCFGSCSGSTTEQFFILKQIFENFLEYGR